MKPNEKAVVSRNGSNTEINQKLTMQIIPNNQTKINVAIYFSDTNQCSFCWRVLPNDSIRFRGIGACPHCCDLAHRFVDSLREHTANYFNNFGGAK